MIVVRVCKKNKNCAYLEALQGGKRIVSLAIRSVVRVACRHGFSDMLGREQGLTGRICRTNRILLLEGKQHTIIRLTAKQD